MIVHNGCVWIAGGGLTRYHTDGSKVNQYVTEHGLVANAVFDAAVDIKNHVLWAATSSGLGRLDLETNQWKSFGRKEGLRDPFVLSLGIFKMHGKIMLFIGTRADGLYFLPGGSDKITRAVDKKMLPDLWVSCIAADPGHNYLWLGTAAGVVRCQLKKGKQPLKIDPLLAHNRIAAKRLVVDEPTGDVFCLNYYSEIFLYRSTVKKWVEIPPFLQGDIEIVDMALDSTGDLLWAATGRGIYFLRIKQKQWVKLPGYRGDVSCITLDKKNRVIYYAARDGIRSVVLEEKEKKSRLLIVNAPPFHNTVSAVVMDEKRDTAWMGTDWGIAKFERKNNRWRFIDLPIYPKERVVTLAVGGKNIWFGTMHHGLGKMHQKTGVIEEIRGTREDSTVTSIIVDNKAKRVWFGLLGTRGGVYEYDLMKKKPRVLPALDGVSVTYLLEDRDWIYVGTGRGVARFHKVKEPSGNLFDPRLAFGQVLTLALDNKRNHLWITTEHEVMVYDRTKKEHKIFKDASGFPWSPITAILFDGERVWLGSEGYGLYVYNSLENIKDSSTRVPGLADRYIISLAHDRKSSSIWVGTVSGGLSIVKIR
ncbi:MAG: hypothetical protein GTO45_34010 [Candidatus Aminicenantes bacterium]|nr:hypothetical protein [Candidatus Aminicenantes bacterium]NIM83725.1 hypothetical protein [Candidatus Aminicenantes bacterium]NIN23150.1 hypothetical protein [Candidatus Aminicenantes bacterium]NIN46877.1 hypothetical protein [Candidatus Aminicenantes bacterium]NIN89799.1 hypothetical protein [Candidatus Aminicenantes bacterium]